MVKHSHRPLPQQQEPSSAFGRQAERQRLITALEHTTQGAGRTLLLTGTMGIGKTCMVKELMNMAHSRGHLVLASAAFPLDDHLPYAVIIGSLGPYLHCLTAPERTALLDGLPHLRRLMGGLPEGEDLPTPDRVALLQEVSRLTERIARDQTLLWCIDDLHLADPASLELFYHLARTIRNQRVMLLGTYRNDQADGLRRLRVPLLALARHGLSEEVRLQRLTADDVALLVKERLGARPARRLLDYLESAAVGTPGIVLSLLDSLQAEGLLTRVSGAVGLSPAAAHYAPPAAREMILERLVPVAPRDREVLDFLAVMGGSAEESELAKAMRWQPAELLAPLAALQEAGLISAQSRTGDVRAQLRLEHPLLREVLYAELPSLVRRRLHAQVAEALETATPVPLERLARQYVGSGGAPNPERALEVLLTVAGSAVWSGSPDGVRYYREALGLVRDGVLPERLPAVLLGLGQALVLSGELNQAREALREAILACEQQGDTRSTGAMHSHAAYIELAFGNLDAIEDHVEKGFACLDPDGGSPELAYLYGMRSNVHFLRSDIPGLVQDATDLARVAESQNTPAARAWHLHARSLTELVSGQVASAKATAEACLEEAWLSGDPNMVATAALDRAGILLLQGDHRAAAALLHDTLKRVPRGYLLVTEHSLGAALGMAEILGGRWQAALHLSDQSMPLEPFMHVVPRSNLGVRAIILIRSGNLAEAKACLDEASQFPRPFVTDCDYAEALLALETGDYQRAAEVGARLTTWSLAPVGIGLLAEAQAALGDVQSGRDEANFLAMMGQLDLPLCTAMACWITALLDRTTGDVAAAVAGFATAADLFDKLAMPFEGARARFEQAKLLAEADRRGAAALGRQSMQAFTQMGAGLWVDRVHLWQSNQARFRQPAKAQPDAPFSSRELEIIRLLDEGLTSAEVASRLVLSARTVEHHLERMYARHGIRNRLSLLRLAREGGFLSTKSAE